MLSSFSAPVYTSSNNDGLTFDETIEYPETIEITSGKTDAPLEITEISSEKNRCNA